VQLGLLSIALATSAFNSVIGGDCTKADAKVSAASPTTNYGAATTFNADGSPDDRSLLRFTVSGIAGRTISSVKLRIWNVDPSTTGGITLHSVTGAWDEAAVNFNTFPAFNATAIGSLGAVTANAFYDIDVTSVVTGEGTYNFALRSTGTDGADFTSREGLAWNAPRLIVNLQ
jgi:hypothetical protein